MTGLLAEFADEAAMEDAARRLRASAGPAPISVETYTPSEPDVSGGGSLLPLIILVAGVAGAAGTFLLETYATVGAYPLDIGGRPNFSWPAYVPMAFEIGVLCAMAGGFFGFLILNRLPSLYDPIDELDSFRRATRDGFFLAVRSGDERVIGRVRTILEGLRPLHVDDFAG